MPTAPSQRGRRRALNLCLAAALLVSQLAEFAVAPSRAKAASAVTTARLNLRTGPSLDRRIILTMPQGVEVTITGDPSAGFYPVVYDGAEGWAYGDFLNMGGGGGGSASGSAVVTSALNLRAGPSTSDAVLTVMPTGATVTLTGDSANGFLSLTYNGLDGWGYSAYIGSGGGGSSNQQSAPSIATGNSVTGSATTTSGLNLRSGPSTSHQVLTVIPRGAQVDLLGDPQAGFYPVAYGGLTGWSYGDYLNIGGGNESSSGGGGGSSDSDWIINIIYAAADRYGQNRAAMLQVAQCESLLNPNAVNRSSGASGLFQFMPGTFASTPYADYDIFDPWANANAAAWMWSVGRRNEWVC